MQALTQFMSKDEILWNSRTISNYQLPGWCFFFVSHVVLVHSQYPIHQGVPSHDPIPAGPSYTSSAKRAHSSPFLLAPWELWSCVRMSYEFESVELPNFRDLVGMMIDRWMECVVPKCPKYVWILWLRCVHVLIFPGKGLDSIWLGVLNTFESRAFGFNIPSEEDMIQNLGWYILVLEL